MLRRPAGVNCKEMEVLHQMTKTAMRTEGFSIVTLELGEKLLRNQCTSLREELKEPNYSEIGSDLYWRFYKLAIDIQVEVAKHSMRLAAHYTLLDGDYSAHTFTSLHRGWPPNSSYSVRNEAVVASLFIER